MTDARPGEDPPSTIDWDDERTRRWLAHADEREQQLAPVSDALFDAARLQPGERVLDVGCGTGPTTERAAALVGSDGRIVGADVSAGMVDAARSRTKSAEIEWLVADVETHAFGAGEFDAVISRFGVMFFSDPVRAFSNLLAATRPGGRLVAAVWRHRDRATAFAIPYAIVADVLARLGVDYSEPAPDEGAFGLGTAERVMPLLETAGWSAVSCEPDDRLIYLGGPGSVEHAANAILDLGPVRMLLEGQPPEVVDAARAAVLADFGPRHDGVGVALPGGFMIISAGNASIA